MGIWSSLTGLFRKKAVESKEVSKEKPKQSELNILIDLESRVHRLSLQCDAFQKTHFRKGSYPGIVNPKKFYREILVPYLRILKWIYNRLPQDKQIVDGVFLVEKNELIKARAFMDEIKDLKGEELDRKVLQQIKFIKQRLVLIQSLFIKKAKEMKGKQ